MYLEDFINGNCPYWFHDHGSVVFLLDLIWLFLARAKAYVCCAYTGGMFDLHAIVCHVQGFSFFKP